MRTLLKCLKKLMPGIGQCNTRVFTHWKLKKKKDRPLINLSLTNAMTIVLFCYFIFPCPFFGKKIRSIEQCDTLILRGSFDIFLLNSAMWRLTCCSRIDNNRDIGHRDIRTPRTANRKRLRETRLIMHAFDFERGFHNNGIIVNGRRNANIVFSLHYSNDVCVYKLFSRVR